MIHVITCQNKACITLTVTLAVTFSLITIINTKLDSLVRLMHTRSVKDCWESGLGVIKFGNIEDTLEN